MEGYSEIDMVLYSERSQ